MAKKDDIRRIKAIAGLHEGKTIRAIAKEVGVSKSLVGQWKKEYEENNGVKPKSKRNKVLDEVAILKKAESKKIKVSDRYSEYIDTLRVAKDRQGKWAGAITETGIRTLKFANKFLAKVEKKEELKGEDIALVKLIPMLLSASASAIKSAGEAEDRAYSLNLLAEKLNELPQQIQANNRTPDSRTVVAND